MATTFSVTITNDGSGNWTPTSRRDATTLASGGTANTLPAQDSVATKMPARALQAAFTAIMNDIAAGN